MSERSISATPPPNAVEFTFQIVREPSSSRPRAIERSNAASASDVSTSSKRSGRNCVTSTSSSGTGRAYSNLRCDQEEETAAER